MPALINLIGNKYGRLTVLSQAPSKHRHTFWNVVCDCGTKTIVQSHYMKSGKTKSCGCFQKEVAKTVKTTHGRSKTKAYYNECAIKSNFGIEYSEYLKMAKEQNNKCAICGCEEKTKGRRLAIDHCHTTGKIRGLLCGSCNRALGGFKDNPDLLSNAIKYLAR